MGKIYSGIEGYKEFVPDYKLMAKDYKAFEAAEDKWLDGLRDKVKTLSKDPYAGKELDIPHADGYARYMVLSLKPVKLIHLPLGDGWDAPYVHRMTAKDIKAEIDGRERILKLFPPRT